MSKATFPNTTRRRLASSVVCRLSSSGAAFFFPSFFFPRPVTPLGQEASQARSLQLLFTASDKAEGLWLGALRGSWPVFPSFLFHDLSLNSDKKPPKQEPHSCCSRQVIRLRGMWLGALRGPWPVKPIKARGLWPMRTLRGLWPGAVTPRGLWPMIALRSLWLEGASRPVACAADEDAIVGPITEGTMNCRWKRRMSQGKLSA